MKNMEFRDLKTQYKKLKPEIDSAIAEVLNNTNFISGKQVSDLEKELAEYVGVKHCVTCANGTDALQLALMAWDVGPGDAVFVPDFTFFSTGEVVSAVGATPIFVDVFEETFNMNPSSLEEAIETVLKEDGLTPKVVAAVDLFGQPADYDAIRPIAEKYDLKILEDAAQGFGGEIRGKKACSFGDISTTSFFPAKPLGCYGDGGAIFTDNDETASLLKSYRVHGKGEDKYDNVRIGMNSRLDTVQAAVLSVKLKAFSDYEVRDVNTIAEFYTDKLSALESNGTLKCPKVKAGYLSSWAQYTILCANMNVRDGLQTYLKEYGIPSMVYYKKPMHEQKAFDKKESVKTKLDTTIDICNRVLSLPMSPYMTEVDADRVVSKINEFFKGIN